MLNAKDICTKLPTKKLSPKLYGPFQVLEKRGNRAFKLEISPRWKINPMFHISLLEPYRHLIPPGREQPPREPENIDGNLDWEVERIVKSEIITYVRRRRQMQEIRYFVKWASCSEDENTWEAPEIWKTLRKWWRNFIGRIRKCQSWAEDEWQRNGFPYCTQNHGKVFYPTKSSSEKILQMERKEWCSRERPYRREPILGIPKTHEATTTRTVKGSRF